MHHHESSEQRARAREGDRGGCDQGPCRPRPARGGTGQAGREGQRGCGAAACGVAGRDVARPALGHRIRAGQPDRTGRLRRRDGGARRSRGCGVTPPSQSRVHGIPGGRPVRQRAVAPGRRGTQLRRLRDPERLLGGLRQGAEPRRGLPHGDRRVDSVARGSGPVRRPTGRVGPDDAGARRCGTYARCTRSWTGAPAVTRPERPRGGRRRGDPVAAWTVQPWNG